MAPKVLWAAVVILAGVLLVDGFPGSIVQARARSADAEHGATQVPSGPFRHRSAGLGASMRSSSWIDRRAATADLDALVNNPAVSGLAIRMFWSSLQPAKDRYDFSQLDAAFASAAAVHKTVQLILVPGFGTPAWVLSELSSCDDLLSAPADRRRPAEVASGGHAAKAGGGRAGKASGRRAESSDRCAQRAAVSGEAPSCGKATFDVSEGRGPRRETRAAAAVESRLQELLESLSHRSRRTVRDARRLRLDRRRRAHGGIGGDHSAARRRSARTLGTTPPTLLPRSVVPAVGQGVRR